MHLRSDQKSHSFRHCCNASMQMSTDGEGSLCEVLTISNWRLTNIHSCMKILINRALHIQMLQNLPWSPFCRAAHNLTPVLCTRQFFGNQHVPAAREIIIYLSRLFLYYCSMSSQYRCVTTFLDIKWYQLSEELYWAFNTKQLKHSNLDQQATSDLCSKLLEIVMAFSSWFSLPARKWMP